MKSKTKKVNPPPFKEWLSSIPKTEGESVAVTVEIQLQPWTWTTLAVTAHRHGWTLDDLVEQILVRESCELPQRNYLLEDEAVTAKAKGGVK